MYYSCASFPYFLFCAYVFCLPRRWGKEGGALKRRDHNVVHRVRTYSTLTGGCFGWREGREKKSSFFGQTCPISEREELEDGTGSIAYPVFSFLSQLSISSSWGKQRMLRLYRTCMYSTLVGLLFIYVRLLSYSILPFYYHLPRVFFRNTRKRATTVGLID